MAMRIGIDTGGTFTDLVGFDAEARRFVYAKSASTPGKPSDALTAVLSDPQLDASGIERIVVGTTVATNAVLQRAGARVIFVTTAGFEDVPFIGRLDKAELYNLNWVKPKPLARRSDCFGVRGADRPRWSGADPARSRKHAATDRVRAGAAGAVSRSVGGGFVALFVCAARS